MSRFYSLSAWAERSKNISAAPRTSNGVWLMIHFILSRVGRSLLYSRSLKRMIRKITFMYLSVINK